MWAAETRVEIKGGDKDVAGSLVEFKDPERRTGHLQLRGESGGNPLPVQFQTNSAVVVLIPELKAGETKNFVLESTSSPEVDSQINVAKGDGVLTFTKGKETKPFLQYQMEPGLVPAGTDEKFKHGAHLHPFFTPAGTLVTGNHPSDHPHQRGIWMSWTKTEFEGRHPDYWNMGKDASGNLTGEILFKRLASTWSGTVRAGFTSVHDWIDHTSGAPKPVLEESWSVSLSSAECAGKPVYLMDFTSDQKCAGSEPLKLPEYHYGGLGVRGPAEWDPVEAVTMSTSEGLDRAKGDGSKAKWVVMKGGSGKTEAGLAVLIHPENFRFPQPLRLNPKNPQLCVAPSRDGDWAIEPNKPLQLRYRMVAFDGPADATWLEALWNGYASPPTVTVK